MIDDLKSLLAPITLKRFVERHWRRRALHLRGRPGKVKGLFDLEQFRAYASAPRSTGVLDMHTRFVSRTGKLSSVRVFGEQMAVMLDHGQTLQINGLARHYPALHSILESIRQSLPFINEGDVGLFLSQHAGSGFDVHFDAMEMFELQIHGSKRWRYSTIPAQISPAQNCAAVDLDGTRDGIRTPEETGLSEVVLKPGDLLYLPAGAWHTTEAMGESAHLSFSFSPDHFVDFFANELLRPLFDCPAWREMPSPGGGSAREQREEMEAYFADRLEELHDSLDLRKLSPKNLYRQWQIKTSVGPLPATKKRTTKPISRRDRLTVVHGVQIEQGPSGRIDIFVDDQEVGSMPGEVFGFLTQLLEQVSFIAARALGWGQVSWAEVQAFLGEALELGILRRGR